MQSFAQLTKVYGQSGGAKELFDLLNTRFFFRSPSSDMARLIASELGEEEIEESRENYSYGANSIRDGISLSTQRVTRPIVSYPQIMELKDLHCFLRLPGEYPVTQLTLKLEKRASLAAGFVERQFVIRNRQALQDGDPDGEAGDACEASTMRSLHGLLAMESVEAVLDGEPQVAP